MWAAIKSDLNEFVTTVKDESATVADKVAPRVASIASAGDVVADDDDQTEEQQRKAEPSLIMVDDVIAYGDEDIGVATEEVERLMAEDETFTEPLDTEDPEVTEFLETFDLEAKTDDIAELLESYPDTLKAQFEALVPTQVQYKDFWERYYFRCDEERVMRDIRRQEEEARRARAEAIAKGVNSVKSLFGGAVKAVSSTLEQYDHARDDEGDSTFAHLGDSTATAKSGSSGGLSLFGHRPPFVMNTAVDEDDGDEEEEEEEEEELGWNDEDSFGEEEEEAEEEQEVDFSGGMEEELAELKRQLSQALEEREQLHQTVEMQTKELAALRLSDGGEKMQGDNDDELEKVKMMLFEKDSELAALRASLEDTQDEERAAAAKKGAAKVASLEREVQRLDELASSKDQEKEQLQAELQRVMEEKQQLRLEVETFQTTLTGTQESQADMERQIASLKEMLATSEAETESIRVEFESYKRDSASHDLKSQEEANVAFAKLGSLEAELEETKGNLEFTTRRADHLEQELEDVKKELQAKETAFEAKMTEEIAKVHAEHEQASHDTTSTGVRVSQELEPLDPEPSVQVQATVEHLAAGDDDDWGDDWGDEDD